MQRTVEHKVKAKITYTRYGEVFFVSTFHQFDVEYVTKLLAQFERGFDYTNSQRRIC